MMAWAAVWRLSHNLRRRLAWQRPNRGLNALACVVLRSSRQPSRLVSSLRKQDFLTMTRLASANKACSCAAFLAKPRYRNLRCRNRFFTMWNGCSTQARTCDGALSTATARSRKSLGNALMLLRFIDVPADIAVLKFGPLVRPV
jgi:hypothetical protein